MKSTADRAAAAARQDRSPFTCPYRNNSPGQTPHATGADGSGPGAGAGPRALIAARPGVLTPHGATATLRGMFATPTLVSRRHVDLGRVASAVCCRGLRCDRLR
ncbi:putative leader peptide [Streptomyces sp. NPDC056352]|uniref:putative leader peptide n=1 Tax=Streptomyces sp. NPDC056352 TaxID=3345791 RepID=UPI0035DFEFAD